MKALVKTEVRNEFRIENRDIPKLSRDELLIKVEYCGICGSDLHAASHAKGYEFVPKPIILGHEFSGLVVEVGSEENKQLLKKRVIIVPGNFCGECEQCKSGKENICLNIVGIGLHHDGGMAEYVKVASNQIIMIPDELPFEIASLAEPLSVAIHAVEQIGGDLKGKKVLVQGCGIIGMFTAIIAKNIGADVTISGLQKDWEHRLSLAELFDIKSEIFENNENNHEKFDYIYECSGSSIATENAAERLNKGGILILVALYEQKVELPMNLIVRSEINVLSSYASTIKDFYSAIDVLQNNQSNIGKLIRIYSLDDGKQAFDDALNQKVLKPVLKI
ncbi:zinc-dependent alcohol dehydrogenase [Bacillus sp. FJAT-45350]|uniref:zinc-dependent alcohol dehydrogenase n=1 Tax=Bacillus sp. FJAT-45350 TaxID=2011014 RepID=UPI000BB6B182|nr:alcohol dehydrogenase catalytic domain-containing protein [Bacillus sp. FJAT-45350]